jgi:FSR family fosmidomycin resistance protein-like MFS transporter
MKSAFTMFLPTYMKANGASLWIGGASLSILQFSGAIGTLFAGPISDRIGRRTSLFFIALVSPILMILFVHSSGALSIFVLIFLGLFMFANGPVILAYVQEIGAVRPAFSNGVYMTISFFISALAAMLIGLLSDHFGLKSSFLIAGLLAFGGVPVVFLLPNKRPE